MAFRENDYIIILAFMCVMSAIPWLIQSTPSLYQTSQSQNRRMNQTSQSQNNILNCISRDKRWTNLCGVARIFRQSVICDPRTELDDIRYYINDTLKHYVAREYFKAAWLLPYLEANPQHVFNRNFADTSFEETISTSLSHFIANVDVLSNCGTGALADIHLVTLFDQLITRIYSALCNLNLDVSNGKRSDVRPSAESMVVNKVQDCINTQNGLSQAINIYVIVSDIERVLSLIQEKYLTQ